MLSPIRRESTVNSELARRNANGFLGNRETIFDNPVDEPSSRYSFGSGDN
jgi:hypothetical protein